RRASLYPPVRRRGAAGVGRVQGFEGSRVRGFEGPRVRGFEKVREGSVLPLNPRTLEPLDPTLEPLDPSLGPCSSQHCSVLGEPAQYPLFAALDAAPFSEYCQGTNAVGPRLCSLRLPRGRWRGDGWVRTSGCELCWPECGPLATRRQFRADRSGRARQ